MTTPINNDLDSPTDDVDSGSDSDSNPDNQDTVVPPVSAGAGGGMPVDDLNPNVQPGADDVDGDGRPDG